MCQTSSTPLAHCTNAGNGCSLTLWRLWVAILVPCGVAVLGCIVACIVCCCREPKKKTEAKSSFGTKLETLKL